VLTAVRRTFITPFDRVDIKNLITSMDDAIDQMQQTAKAVMLFEVRNSSRRCARWARSSSSAPTFWSARAAADAIDRRERRDADRHHRGTDEARGPRRRSARYRPEGAVPEASHGNTMDFIVGVEVYDHLEKVADRFDDVANEINSIVIEQVYDGVWMPCRRPSAWTPRSPALSIAGRPDRVALLFDFLNGLHDAPTPSPPSFRPACCGRNTRCSGRRSSTSSRSCSSACMSPNTIGTGIVSRHRRSRR
jgi:hypothetical protein